MAAGVGTANSLRWACQLGSSSAEGPRTGVETPTAYFRWGTVGPNILVRARMTCAFAVLCTWVINHKYRPFCYDNSAIQLVPWLVAS